MASSPRNQASRLYGIANQMDSGTCRTYILEEFRGGRRVDYKSLSAADVQLYSHWFPDGIPEYGCAIAMFGFAWTVCISKRELTPFEVNWCW